MILHASELATELFDEVQTPESKMYVDRDGTSSRNFTAIRGCFVLGTARVKALGCLKKKKEEEEYEKEDDETRFSPLPGSSL